MTGLCCPDPPSQACNLELQKPGMFVFGCIASSLAHLPVIEASVLNPILPYCLLLSHRAKPVLNGCQMPPASTLTKLSMKKKKTIPARVIRSRQYVPFSPVLLSVIPEASPRSIYLFQRLWTPEGRYLSLYSNAHPEIGWKPWESQGNHRYMRDMWILMGGYDALTCKLSGHCNFSMLLSILKTLWFHLHIAVISGPLESSFSAFSLRKSSLALDIEQLSLCSRDPVYIILEPSLDPHTFYLPVYPNPPRDQELSVQHHPWSIVSAQ